MHDSWCALFSVTIKQWFTVNIEPQTLQSNLCLHLCVAWSTNVAIVTDLPWKHSIEVVVFLLVPALCLQAPSVGPTKSFLRELKLVVHNIRDENVYHFFVWEPNSYYFQSLEMFSKAVSAGLDLFCGVYAKLVTMVMVLFYPRWWRSVTGHFEWGMLLGTPSMIYMGVYSWIDHLMLTNADLHSWPKSQD